MIRDLIEDYIGEEKAVEFAKWAFGDSYKEINYVGKEPVNAWNERHKDSLEIFSHGNPRVDIPKMISVWQNETCQIKD